jgi:hypothetical protein
MRFYDYLKEKKDGHWIDMKVSHRHGLSRLSDIVVERVEAEVIYSASFGGTAGSKLSGVSLKSVHIKLLPPNHIARDSGNKPFLVECGDNIAHGGLVVQNLTVEGWSGGMYGTSGGYHGTAGGLSWIDSWAGLSNIRNTTTLPLSTEVFAVCEVAPTTAPALTPTGCEAELIKDGCCKAGLDQKKCETCGEKFAADPRAAGCTTSAVKALCKQQSGP